MRRMTRCGCMAALLTAALLCTGNIALADENRRYRAYPHGGGLVILDGKEGHLWIWQGPGGKVSKGGESDHLSYQGNVRKNMTPASPGKGGGGLSPSVQPGLGR